MHGRAVTARKPRIEPGISSLYQHVPFRQDTSYLAIGERTNANGSKAFREAMLEQRFDDCVEIARSQTRDGSHLLDLCVDYVGRDGVEDMRAVASRFATASTLPIVLDSTEPAVIESGLECLGGRSVVNSVNYEDGDGPQSRFARTTRIAVEHGAALIALTIDEQGQARTPEHKVAVAERLIADLTGNWGIRESDIIIDCLTFTIATGPGGVPRRRGRHDRGHPRAQAPPPRRADHARTVEHLLRAQPGGAGGAELGVPARMREGGAGLGDRARGSNPADLTDSGGAVPGRAGPHLRPAATGGRPAGYDPLARFLELFEGRRLVRGAEPGRGTRRPAAVRTAGAADRRR